MPTLKRCGSACTQEVEAPWDHLVSSTSSLGNSKVVSQHFELKNLNYKGWMDTVDLGSKGSIIEHTFTWKGQNTPVSSMYIGTSPELELALNTVCWHARPNAKCQVSLNGNPVGIQTYDISQNGKKYIASAYPDLSP